MAEFTMPSLGADMDEGLLVEWLVGPGDRVSKGDVVAVVETDKAAIEVECFASGTVGSLLVEPGTRVPVGTPLAVIESGAAAGMRKPGRREAAAAGEAGEAKEAEAEGTADVVVAVAHTTVPASAENVTAAGRPAVVREPEDVEAEREAPGKSDQHAEPELPPRPRHAEARRKGDRKAGARQAPRKPARKPTLTAAAPVPPGPAVEAKPVVGAGPLVRHLAAERGVDLRSVHGTGRGGRITRADVERTSPVAVSRVRVTPYARRLAHELDVDLAELDGTGDGHAVRAADVRAAVRARGGGLALRQPGGPQREERQPVVAPPAVGSAERAAAMRRAIGDLMARSKREIPHYYLSTTIDLASAQEWLHRRNRGRPPSDRLVPAALLLKAAAVAARGVPQLNGFWQDGRFVPGSGVHLGVVVSLRDGGLLAPVVHDADTLAPAELMAALKDLVQLARLGRLRGSELSGATLTVTSLGEQGVESVFGVIHPPQVALVGFGAVVERPWATGGLLGVRPVVTATLSADHRVTDGAIGARYLTAVDRLLQKPEEL